MAKLEYHVRVAHAEDLPGMLELWSLMMVDHEAFDPRIRLARGAEGAYRAYLSYHLGNEESIVTVAAERGESGGERILGFCLAAVNRNLPMFLPARYGYLSDLVVDSAARRMGMGRGLVEATSEWFKEQGIDSIQLQVYSKNDAAADFWTAMGFDPFYQRMWLDLA